MPNKHIELLPPALSALSLASVGYSVVRLGADDDGFTTVAIGTVAELTSIVELISSVELDRAISMPEGLRRKVWPSSSVAKSPSLARVVPPTLIAPEGPSAASAVTVSDPATKGTRVGSEAAVISVRVIAVPEETNTKPEDSALITWPLMVATGSSEWIVWPSTTIAPGRSDAWDAVTVRFAAASVEGRVGTACTIDGSVDSAELTPSEEVGIATSVGSVAGAVP